MQARTANATAARTPTPVDPKRKADFGAYEDMESLRIVDVGICSVGVGTDVSFTGSVFESTPMISVPDALPHNSDDFLAVHAYYSSWRSPYCCIPNVLDK